MRAILFDVIGTLTDWRSSVAAALAPLGLGSGSLADEWVDGYGAAVAAIREGRMPWAAVDEITRRTLVSLLRRYGIDLPPAKVNELNRVWHGLRTWPDVRDGIVVLEGSYLVAPLSNANSSMLLDISKKAGCSWTRMRAVDQSLRRYKPDPEVYVWALRELGLRPGETIMAAAHAYDIRAAAELGFLTAYIDRPHEFGAAPSRALDLPRPGDRVDFRASSLVELASKLRLGKLG